MPSGLPTAEPIVIVRTTLATAARARAAGTGCGTEDWLGAGAGGLTPAGLTWAGAAQPVISATRHPAAATRSDLHM
jgi:hypothetical protein